MANLTEPSLGENPESYQLKESISKGFLYLILTIGAVIAIVPFLWMLLTSIKTYGEHGSKAFWPAGLSSSPYLERPATQNLTIPMRPAEGWQNIPRSFSPPLEGSIPVESVSHYVAQRLEGSDIQVPFDVNILATDTTSDEQVNYDAFIVSGGF